MIVSIDYTEPTYPDVDEPDMAPIRAFARASYRAVEIYEGVRDPKTYRFAGEGFAQDWANAMQWLQDRGQDSFMVSSSVDDFCHDAGYDLTEEGEPVARLVLTEARGR